jgi:hypothetical protein
MAVLLRVNCQKVADDSHLDGYLRAYFRILLVFLMISTNAPVASKEAVIFEQIGQLDGGTAYLHVHVGLSISSVEAQLNKYTELLLEHCRLSTLCQPSPGSSWRPRTLDLPATTPSKLLQTQCNGSSQQQALEVGGLPALA